MAVTYCLFSRPPKPDTQDIAAEEATGFGDLDTKSGHSAQRGFLRLFMSGIPPMAGWVGIPPDVPVAFGTGSPTSSSSATLIWR